MVQTPVRRLAIEEFLQLLETKPASEFIDGQIWQKPMPQGKHSTIQSELAPAISAVLKPPRIARAYTELRCSFGGRATVPDIAVVTWERIPRDENGEVANVFGIAPDWTICFQQRCANEILSPDQQQTKVVRNILYCLSHGTQLGWLIDPAEKLVFAYFADRTIAIFEQSSDLLPVPDFAQTFSLTVGELFGWLVE